MSSTSPQYPGETLGSIRTSAPGAGFVWNVLAQRILILALVLGAEALVASVLLDGASLSQNRLADHGGALSGFLAAWGAWGVKAMVGFAALFTTFSYLKYRAALSGLSNTLARNPIRPTLLTAHFFAIAAFAYLSSILYGSAGTSLPLDLIVSGWALAAAGSVLSIAIALVPAAAWVNLVRSTGSLWAYASAASVSACALGIVSQRLWEPAARLTFGLVRLILSPLLSNMILEPERLRIGTRNFTVMIAPECSGLEGVGLLLIFGSFWLFLFREEIRFPQSLALLPGGVLLLFLLNAVRIAALILIGNAGAREIALGGFHSQAGWIAFNTVAFGLCIAARHVPWFAAGMPGTHVPKPQSQQAGVAADATAAYLIPFLSILAAGILARAVSGSFEWMYSLRLFAALGALWLFRKWYAALEWKAAWTPPLLGALAFAIWIAPDWLSGTPHGPAPMPVALANASPLVRILWITLRVLGAVITVPITEELAFRGFLLRRLVSPHFELIPFQAVTWFSWIVSSLVFGLLHGGFWIVGAAAGFMYAGAARYRGRLTDAMIAHATTNGLLAVYVLLFPQWRLW